MRILREWDCGKCVNILGLSALSLYRAIKAPTAVSLFFSILFLSTKNKKKRWNKTRRKSLKGRVIKTINKLKEKRKNELKTKRAIERLWSMWNVYPSMCKQIVLCKQTASLFSCTLFYRLYAGRLHRRCRCLSVLSEIFVYKWRLFVIHLLILNHLTLIFVLHTLKMNYLNNRFHSLSLCFGIGICFRFHHFACLIFLSLARTLALSLSLAQSIASVPLIHLLDGVYFVCAHIHWIYKYI